MTRVLFIQPSLQPPGGGNGLAAWMLEALRHEYSIAVYTWRPVDIDQINRFWGTTLSRADIRADTVPAALRVLVDAVPLPLALLKTALLMRFARRRFLPHDLLVSANNEMDFGQPGIQYVHYPTYERPRPRVDLRWYHHLSPGVLAGYYALCDGIAAISARGLQSNLTLVNSNWTAAKFRQRYGASPRTVYPPVTGVFPDVPWAERQNGFVCLGRIAPEKDIETVIEIVSAVRHVHGDVRLHIVGSPGARRYYRGVLRRIAREPWITLHLDLAHEDVRRVLAENRYGLHAMEDEHFGMAPAEMATAGCIVWVREGGGQVEVVGGESRLMFRSIDDAVAKILRTMNDATEQAALRAALAAVTPRFAAARFMQEVRDACAELAERQRQSQ